MFLLSFLLFGKLIGIKLRVIEHLEIALRVYAE